MAGGHIQLVATGITDLYLTGDPQINWFKSIYRQYCEFSMADIPIHTNTDIQFGSTHYIKIKNEADKLNRITLIIDVPTPELKMQDPIAETFDSLANSYDVLPPVYNTLKKPKDTIEYNELFNNDVTSFGSTLVTTAKTLNKKYDARLDVLEYITTTYGSTDGKFTGKYMAIRSDKLQLRSPPISTKPIDPRGYLLLTYDKSLELLTSDLLATFDPSSFVYRSDLIGLNSSTSRIVPADVLQIATTGHTTDKVAIVHPYTINGFQRIETIDDISNVNLSDKFHILLSVSDMINIKQRTLDLRKHSQQSIIIDGSIESFEEQTSINFDENIKLMFTNFDYKALLDNTGYLSGLYVFEINPTLSDDIYYERVEQILNTSKISVKLSDVSTTIKNSDIVSNVFDPSNIWIDRFDLDQNVSYDSQWYYEQSGLTSKEKQFRGFWLVDLSSYDQNPTSQDILEIIETSNGVVINVNPKYILSVQAQIGFSPFTINKTWSDVLTKTYVQLNPDDNPQLQILTKKLPNTPDGITALAKITNDLYEIPSITNVIEISPTSIASLTDIGNLQTMLIKMLDDIVELQSESRNYKLLNYNIYNSVDIRKLIYKKLIKDIIYVDKRKIVDIPTTLSKYRRNTLKPFFGDIIEDIYEVSPSFVPPYTSISDEYTFSRQIIYDTLKFLAWSYYLENLYLVYNPLIDNKNEIKDSLSKLSHMLLYLPLDPSTLDPVDESSNANDDPTTQKMRFGTNNIKSIQDTIVYDDDTIIENFNKTHRMTGTPNTNIFDTHYLFASERYDNLSSQDTEFMDNNIYSEFTDGYRTCINREVEMYHSVLSLDNTDAELDMIVYEHFMRLIIELHDDPKNYIYTLAFRSVERFLRTYYKDVKILNLTSSLDAIAQELGTLIIKTVNIVMNNYTKLLFKIWKNSTYSDIENTPRVGSTLAYDNIRTINIDYDANYIKNTLEAMYSNGDITNDQLQLGDPIKLRAKYYAGVDIDFRPLMGYSNQYSLDLTNSDSLVNPTETISNTDKFFGIINDFIDNAKSKDELTEHINKSKIEMETEIQNIFISYDGSAVPLSYLYWRDLNKTMQIVCENINQDYTLVEEEQLAYFPNVAVLNHLPLAILHRYGQYLQHAIINNASIAQILGDITNQTDTMFDLNRYNMHPIEIEEYIDKELIFNVEPPSVDGLKLRFMGTDVRPIPFCPFHGSLEGLLGSPMMEAIKKFLITGDIEYVNGKKYIIDEYDEEKYFDICPLCFRTLVYSELYGNILDKTLLTPDAVLLNNYKIVDTELIKELTIKASSVDATLLKNTNINDFSQAQYEYSTFLYRPEEVFYDDVSRSYFITAIEFVVHRIAASLFRYGSLVTDIVSRDLDNFEQWVFDNAPDPLIIGEPNIVDGKTEIERYDDYIEYLISLRTENDQNSLIEFNTQLDKLCAVITHTSDSVDNFNIIKRIYKDPNNTESGETVYDKYSEAISYIGNKYKIETSVNNYGLIPNVFYSKDDPTQSGVKIVREQFYIGNITYWTLLQHRLIKLYNRLLDNIFDPREVTNENVMNIPEILKYLKNKMTPTDLNAFIAYTKTRNRCPDLYNEIYNILRKEFNPIYVNKDNTLNFYRSKEIIEYSKRGEVNELKNPVSTSMINHCRHLMIFFNMLINRYNKMKFMLKVREVSLNRDNYFYNMSQTIAEGYLKNSIEQIQNMKIIDVNSQKNEYISQGFYYNDTSRYYFLNPNSFYKSITSIGSLNLGTDYLSFSYNDSYHLSQAFTFNQLMCVFKLIGLRDELNAQLYLSTSETDKYYNDISKSIKPILNDDFKKYVSVDISTTPIILNNYELYLREMNVIYDPTTGYNFDIVIDRSKVDGVFNRIWYYAPTVSNILYDQYYKNVVIDEIDNTEITDSNYFDYDIIKHRTYTQCRLTSPLIFLINKLTESVNNVFTHTSNMKIWEKTFHDTYATPTSNIIRMKQNEQDAWIGLYSAYSMFVGSYEYTPVSYLLLSLIHEFLEGDASMNKVMQNIRILIEESINRLAGGFNITNPILRKQHILSAVTLEYIRLQRPFDNIIHNRSVKLNNLNNKLIEFKLKILELLHDDERIQQTVVDSIENIETIFRASTDIINSINIALIITDIKQNLDTITNETILRQIFYMRFDTIQNNITQIEEDRETAVIYIITLIQQIGIVFMKTDVDERKYTPTILFDRVKLGTETFKTFKDVLYLILTDIIKFITPNDITRQEILAYENNDPTFNSSIELNINGIDNKTGNTIISNIFIRGINESPINTLIATIQNIKLAIKVIYTPMSKICYLDRYIDPNRDDVLTFHRYNLDSIILGTEIGNSISRNYNEAKNNYIKQEKNTAKGLTKYATYNIRQKNEIVNRLNLNAPITRYVNNNANDTTSENIHIINTYYNSEIYNQIIKIFTKQIPSHAWTRYLGLRIIEQISLVIDGEYIDETDSYLMLMLHKLMTSVEHERGDNILLGHIPEMYTISNVPKPAMRLYVSIPLFFCKEYGNSLNLINMLYSDSQIKLKTREINELLYIERGAELSKPIRIKCQLFGNYIYLGDEERRLCATIKQENLIERYKMIGPYIRGGNDLKNNINTDFGVLNNILILRYTFEDPAKYLIWRIDIEYPDSDNTDKIHWDLAGYRQRNTYGIINTKSGMINPVEKVMIEFNNKIRERWRDSKVYQLLQPYNHGINGLDIGEGIYNMCLYPRLLQPSGSTNMTVIDNVTYNFQINKDIATMMRTNGLRLKIRCWVCSYNLFVTMSGFGALRFYGTK